MWETHWISLEGSVAMKKPNKLYIVTWQYEEILTIGYLPFSKAPDALVKALKTACLHVEPGGFRGIYDNKKLAEAHLRAERKWRLTGREKVFKEDLWLTTIEPKV